MQTMTIDRRPQYARKEAANRTPDFTWRFVRGHRLQLALIARFRRQDAGERVCK